MKKHTSTPFMQWYTKGSFILSIFQRLHTVFSTIAGIPQMIKNEIEAEKNLRKFKQQVAKLIELIDEV